MYAKQKVTVVQPCLRQGRESIQTTEIPKTGMLRGWDREIGWGEFSLFLAQLLVHPQISKLCFKIKIGSHLNKV